MIADGGGPAFAQQQVEERLDADDQAGCPHGVKRPELEGREVPLDLVRQFGRLTRRSDGARTQADSLLAALVA